MICFESTGFLGISFLPGVVHIEDSYFIFCYSVVHAIMFSNMNPPNIFNLGHCSYEGMVL